MIIVIVVLMFWASQILFFYEYVKHMLNLFWAMFYYDYVFMRLCLTLVLYSSCTHGLLLVHVMFMNST
jgi:hypothetical protein